MGGQTYSQVGSHVHASRKFYSYTVDLCRLALGDPNGEKLFEFVLDQSQRNWVAKRNASCITQVENLRWFASPPFIRVGFRLL